MRKFGALQFGLDPPHGRVRSTIVRFGCESGLAVLSIGLVFVTVVNVHDLLAHMAGIDCRFERMGSDTQLALVEYAAPSIQALGSILTLPGILIFLVQVPLRFSLKNRA